MAKRRTTYAASEVARRLDVNVDTLRRMPDVTPVRTESKHRRYPSTLVSELEMRLLSEAIGPGWKVNHRHQITATAPDGWTTTFEVSDPLWNSDPSAVRESLGGTFRFVYAQAKESQ